MQWTLANLDASNEATPSNQDTLNWSQGVAGLVGVHCNIVQFTPLVRTGPKGGRISGSPPIFEGWLD